MAMSVAIENLVAAAPIMTLSGGAVAWLWSKIEKRFKRIEEELEKCRQRELHALERRGTHLTVIELLWNEIKRLAPDAEVLDRAQHLLERLKKGGQA